MKLNIVYAVCTAAMALSCENQSRKLESIDKTSAVSDVQLTQPEKKEELAANYKVGIASVDSASAPVNNNGELQSGSPINPDWDKKIIKTANVTLELKNYNAYNSSIHTKLKAYGAYIAQEQQSETDYQISNSISIKVPVDKFDNLLNSLQAENVKVLEKNISTEDVTGEVVDIKARIEAKKQVRAKYLELLKQAKNMDEILQVQNEINTIQENIESATGRVNYLVHSASYSTINLKYFQYFDGAKPEDKEPNFFIKLTEAFKTGASVITDLILFCISIWPFMIIGILTVLYFRRLSVKKV